MMEEKSLIFYYAKYISGSESKDAHVHIYEDRIEVKLLKDKWIISVIPYKNMIDIQKFEGDNKLDMDRIVGFGIVGLLWKRHHTITVIKYVEDDGETKEKTIAIDLLDDTKYAQPIIHKKILEANPIPEPIVSIADEISKLAKLKEQS